MQMEYLGKPCRRYVFLSAEYIPCDPRDGKEKYVLGTQGSFTRPPHVVIVDPETMQVEDYEVPTDTAVWAMVYLPEYGRLMVGANGIYGYLYGLDLKTRTWMPGLRLENEIVIWDLTRGGDGLVYGASYPGCVLYCYDPEAHTLISAGRVSSNPKNVYNRYVFTLPDGNVLSAVGMFECESHVFDVKTRQFRQVFEPGDQAVLVTDALVKVSNRKNGYRFYDAHTFEPLTSYMEKVSEAGITDPAVLEYLRNQQYPKGYHLLPYGKDCQMKELKDGRMIGHFNDQLFLTDGETITYFDFPNDPAPMGIHGLAEDDKGIVWFAHGMGQGMGWYDPKTGEYWNSKAVTKVNGEIYGVVPYEGRVYFTAYAGGDHIVYDPEKPWDQYNNINPQTLKSVGPMHMGRPIAGSILGPDGNIWTGWCGTYGMYGGGLSRLDPNTHEVTGWFGVVPEQSIGYIAAGEDCIYAVSNWQCSGMPYKFDDEFKLLKLDTDCNILWSETFPKGRFPENVVSLGGRLYLTLRDQLDGMAKIAVYDGKTMQKRTEKTMHPLGGPGRHEVEEFTIRGLLAYGEDKLVMFVDKKAHLVDAQTLEILQTAELPDMPLKYTVAKDKTVYFSIDEKLYKILFD